MNCGHCPEENSWQETTTNKVDENKIVDTKDIVDDCRVETEGVKAGCDNFIVENDSHGLWQTVQPELDYTDL